MTPETPRTPARTAPGGRPRVRDALLTGSDRTTTFRVAEDRTFAGVDGAALTLPDDATVSPPHPMTLGEEALRAWRQIFADYEIQQPFLQLARPTHTLTERNTAWRSWRGSKGAPRTSAASSPSRGAAGNSAARSTAASGAR
ncbi:DUF4132 domain-containing protein [Actinomadura kijaniata]|uniref:DUF4132 domain-containing protein n=1 Tax=Actinomadura kijaniata TaxID=46161 RepID=UPI00350E538E